MPVPNRTTLLFMPLVDSERCMSLIHSVDATTISGICTHSGYVKMAPEEDINGLLVSDCLTDVLANPRSENVNLYSDNEKQELIYKAR